uniref:At1g61320/AtMIF1 LRR domain-containing protein n=2 Tax=Setaria italica TaxID=4555 RepID=K3ZL08_SETIT
MEEIQTSSPCSWQPRRLRRRPRANTTDETNGGAPCTAHQPLQANEAASQGTVPELPEDALQHIHSLMTMRDAACVSRRFLFFWRRYPNLAFNQEYISGYRGKYVFSKAQYVLENHSGVGVKMLKLNLSTCSKKDIDINLLDGWLRAFIKPGITELAFLHLASCDFHPTEGPRLLGCSRSLSTVCLHNVRITGDEVGFFLSSCFALERLDLSKCSMITSLKIPRVLHKLRIVQLHMCQVLQTVEINALNLSPFNYNGCPLSSFSLGDSLETKELLMHVVGMPDLIQYVGCNVPSIAPNLEMLMLSTVNEKLKAPAIFDKFQHLKHLVICLGKRGEFFKGYDFFSLAHFLDACVALETFTLRIQIGCRWYDMQSRVAIMPFRHGGLRSLRKATITGFCSSKSLVELTCHILRSAASSLQFILLDTSRGYDWKHSLTDRCRTMGTMDLQDSERALFNIRQYVEPKVPPGVELKVLGPCSRCHSIDAKAMEEATS